MTKSEFLKKLRYALRWKFTREETKDILLDYDEFFVLGKNEGKDEIQICKELGDPSAIALDLSQIMQNKNKYQLLLSAKTFGQIFIIISLFATGFAFYYFGSQIREIILYVMFFISFVIILWFTLDNTFQRLRSLPSMLSKSQMQIIVCFHSCLIVMMVLCCFLNNQILRIVSSEEIVSIAMIVICLKIVLIIASILIIVAIYGFIRYAFQYFTVIINAFGIVSYLTLCLRFLERIDDPFNINVARFVTFILIYVTAILLSAIFSLYIFKFKKTQLATSPRRIK